MPVTVSTEDGSLHDPDDLKMPESPLHRRAIDAIGLAATSLLGADFDIFRDMNWYPTDGGNAMAPDVMVLPAGAFVAAPDAKPGAPVKSYRQDKTGGPPPIVVIEVPSDTDGHDSLRAKAHRCRALGVPVYIVSIEDHRMVERLDPRRPGSDEWIDRPIPELGNLRLTFRDGVLTVVTPDGVHAGSDYELLAARQAAAEQRAAEQEQRAAEQEQCAAELERRLREAGIDPDG